MPIQSDDIKLLKSAVMADVPEGGGAMTGIPVVDGETNNVFPDISSDDRAAGRVNCRKLFGAGHSDDNDLLLGASFAVLKPPADPLVHCTVFETGGWADELSAARDAVQKYLVKGARLLSRVQDVHYAGALILQLYNIAPATSFPEPGDTVVLFNPSGQEQFVRVLKTATSTALVAIGGTGGLTEVNLCTCELRDPMEFDLLGRQIQFDPPIVTNTATVYSTTPAVGTVFHGVKKLGIPAAIGDFTITVADGIFTPLVPANTVPEPVIDIYPLVERPTLSRTAVALLALPSATRTLAPTTVLQLPTACEPASLVMTHGATTFTSNNAGQLLQGETVVGTVDYINRTITMAGGAPNYGSATNAISYRPATVTGATAHSMGFEITTANQSTAYVFAFDPPPAPATLTVSYMAQGRWYDLTEDGTGKISGASSAYGAGTLNFLTGSMALTLGAPPDVGGLIVMTWGEAGSAVPATGLPSRAWSNIPLSDAPAPGTLAFEWPTGAGTQTATVAADGTVTGPAQVQAVQRLAGGGYQVPFSPNVLPTGPVTVSYTRTTETSAFTNDGGGQYTLTGAPIQPGSVRFQIVATSGTAARVLQCFTVGTVVYAGSTSTVIGTINNTTGVMLLNGASSVNITQKVQAKVLVPYAEVGFFSGPTYRYAATNEVTAFPLDRDNLIEIGYLPTGGGAAESFAIAPSWFIDTNPPLGLAIVTNGMAFNWAGQVHFTRDGVLFRGWAATTGIAEAAGSASSDGRLNFTSVPAGGTNSITWSNAAHDARGGLDIFGGVFRVPRAPLQAGSFQLQVGSLIGNANSGGVISGDFTGLVDFARGIIYWEVAGVGPGPAEGTAVRADEVTYNAVYLQYIPLDETLLGLSTARLPIDGKVPIFRSGGQVIVHNTLTTALPNPLTKGTAYSLGRERIAAVNVRTAAGVRVPGALYTVDFDAGEITVPVESDITGYDQPFTVHHRIEDELLCARADISGALDLVAGLTHNYPADTSYVSSKLRKGDLFSRVFNYLERTTWSGDWSDTLGGSEPTASFNNIDFPIVVTNRGAITERWAVIFTGATLVRVVGQNVGQVLTNVSITEAIEAINAQTDVPYFSIPALGWGGGWSVGNVLRFNTQAAGSPAWIARTVLQGPATLASDSATLAFRSDVDAP
ncbi:hypothetical protein [Hydrogenophaga sp.]|uniref:hypothetical protein n=1 Tax=Hydrogenophaga sp. TaxID=1904254 RepID=UPI002715C8AF|nr:hypothetical protein [Hydrogenophaga sp.]MDO8903963.1 hypothetical protein [Hydrogenophaga sp.]